MPIQYYPTFALALPPPTLSTAKQRRAAVELAEAAKLSGDDRHSSIAKLLKAGETGSGYWGLPKIRALYEATYFAGLRKAGMPEE